MNYGYWTKNTQTMYEANCALAQYVMEKAISASTPMASPISVLDIGCGYGIQDSFWVDMCKRKGISINIQAVDISVDQILYAVQNIKPKPPCIHFHVGDALTVDKMFFGQKFDIVTSLESAFHYSDRPRFFKNVSTLINPNSGRFVISDIVVKPHLVGMGVKAALRLFADFLNIPRQNWITGEMWTAQLAEHFDVVQVEDITANTFEPLYIHFVDKYLSGCGLPSWSENVASLFCKYQPFEYKVALCRYKSQKSRR